MGAIGLYVGLAFLLGVVFMVWPFLRQAGKKSPDPVPTGELVPSILEKLAEENLSLPDLAHAIGRGGWFERGDVVKALGGLEEAGKVERLPAPPNTPPIKLVEMVRYRLVETPEDPAPGEESSDDGE